MLQNLIQNFRLKKGEGDLTRHFPAHLMAGPSLESPLAVKIDWIEGILHWVLAKGYKGMVSKEDSDRNRSAKLRLLMQYLDRNPPKKRLAAQILQSILKEVSYLDLFAATGLQRQYSFVGALVEQIFTRL